MPTTDLTTLFTDIANAIRGKDGTSATITASDFPARITAIPSGGGGVTINLSGDLSYLDYHGEWDDTFTDSNITLTFTNVTNLAYAFDSCNLTSIDLTGITFPNNSVTSINSIVNGCTSVETITIPNLTTITGSGNYQGASAFNGCTMLRTINIPNLVSTGANNMFSGCKSLREIPFKICSGDTKSTAQTFYKSGCNSCFTLNKIEDLGVSATAFTSNVFVGTFSSCCRIKKLTFDTNNGTPLTANWKSQTIDLSSYVGYALQDGNIISFNSGITTAKKVTDATSYAALKNDPDWYTLDVAYSRYDHDSAVETINSLPDVSGAGGTNTIKFKGASGSATDAGAINTLTSAEIAVATAKGWTVSLV